MGRESRAKFGTLEQFLFENKKQPFEDYVSDMLKLNAKLFR